MKIHHILYSLFILFLCLSCDNEKGPDSLPPVLQLDEATQIGRNEAHISGQITVNQTHTTIATVCFRYGTDPQMEKEVTCEATDRQPATLLSDLQPNTTYYYCLQVGNGYQTVRSEVGHFTTQPSQAPTLGELQLISQGPINIALQCTILDPGGEPITETGFYYAVVGEKAQKFPIEPVSSTLIQGKIKGLLFNKEYELTAYARNSIGETLSNPFRFHTQAGIILTSPGTLHEIIDDHHKYDYTSLEVAGPINGTDIRLLRDMLGRGLEGDLTPGRLSVLKLTDATICQGGISYNGSHYTQNDVIGINMFNQCEHLTQLSLPESATRIELNAVSECPKLTSLHIPTKISQIEPSNNCPKLTNLHISIANPHFKTHNGILYNAAGTRLVWFPEGKTECTLLETIDTIGKHAFHNCQLEALTLPNSVKILEENAFYGSNLKSFTVPPQVQKIPTGCFQSCRQLTTIHLSEKTNYLESYSLHQCPLQEIYVKNTIFPPICEDQVFNAQIYETCILYVPASSVQQFKNATHWSNFINIRGVR